MILDEIALERPKHGVSRVWTQMIKPTYICQEGQLEGLLENISTCCKREQRKLTRVYTKRGRNQKRKTRKQRQDLPDQDRSS